MATSKSEAERYLESLLNKHLRITTTDARMFRGEFKCTDSDRNIILAHAYEYRMPTASSKPVQISVEKVVKNMTSRYLGLVVVPGEHIVEIELEEFASQVKARQSAALTGQSQTAVV